MLQGFTRVQLQVQTLSCIALMFYQDQKYVCLSPIKYCGDSDLQPLLHQLRVTGQGSRVAPYSLLLLRE